MHKNVVVRVELCKPPIINVVNIHVEPRSRLEGRGFPNVADKGRKFVIAQKR